MKTAETWQRLELIFAILAVAVLAVRMTDAISVSAQTKTKVNPDDGLTYVWIAPGTFQMGCSTGDSECGDEEKPAHSVTITNGFWIGQTPVTQEAFGKVARAHAKDFEDVPADGNPSTFKGGQLPVEALSWDDADAYCTDVKMRLPTEAEWEYAARGGTTTPTYAAADQIAWYSANSNGTTHEVKKKQANNYGLYDMLGNVWEWVADFYGPYTEGSATDPKGPARGEFRVLRGGSWNYDSSFIRASFRLWDDPEGPRRERPSPFFGFRCAGN